jgi:quercetin dioxygenase-like cupin family protein
MKIENVPFATVDWTAIAPVDHPGEHGTATWRTLEIGNVRVRKVDYSPGYLADHWCSRGHVLLVLEGELTTELQDGRRFQLTAGMSYHVADGAEPHRSSTTAGARLFIVD